MSRSYKKTPGWCDRSPFGKRQANKKVRHYKKYLPNGRCFKKLYCSYDIHDWKSLYFSKNEIIFDDEKYAEEWALCGLERKSTPIYKYYMK